MPYIATPPVLLRAVPEAGAFVFLAGRYRYDGTKGTIEALVPVDAPVEHPAPSGELVAIERQKQAPNGSLVASELALRDRAGTERVIYRAPETFYWSSWSPDGRYVALWEVDVFSGSLDQDGRPLLVLDVASGARVELGRTLLNGTTAWRAPHTLAFVSGGFRMVWSNKSLWLWSPEEGIRELSAPGTAALAPVWSADGRWLYFVSGPAGDYDPLAFFAGRGVGDRRISLYDVATGRRHSLEHEPGYVEEGVRPSSDGKSLLVLRRRTVQATDLRAVPDAPLEVWLTDVHGAQASALVRITNVGFGSYGWYPGPSDWAWSR